MMERMRRQTLLLLFTLSISSFCGCASSSAESLESSQTNESAAIIQEVETLPDAEIIMPSALVGDEITKQVIEDSTVSETDAGNNTTKISLTGEERTEIVNNLSSEISDKINTILEDEDYYPDVVSITPNNDCTEFVIALKDGVMNTYESMLVMSFYMVGDKYQIYCGIPSSEAKTVVTYINADTGEIINQSDSTSMDTFSE